MRSRLSWVLFAGLCGCYQGTDGGSDGADEGGSGGIDEEDVQKVAPAGMRRLSRHEYDNVLFSILQDGSRPGEMLLPEDSLTPFDNDVEAQIASLAYVEAAEVVAREAAQRLVDDPARRDQVVGCAPDSATDASCMDSFVASFGRRALRRPLGPDEVTEYSSLGLSTSEEADDFYAGVEVVVSALLLDPEFLYRVEIGTPVDDSPGMFKLSGNEVATRLSFFLMGTTPSDELLDAADAGELGTDAGVREAATQLLFSIGAREQVDRFHALWLGYHKIPIDPDLALSMRNETRALLDAYIFDEGRSWLDVFTASGTFVDDTLAQHYGLPAPGSDSPTWVDYGGNGRAGLLSHGAFLAVGGGASETSPTRRGKMIRTRLMCETIPPPPPEVDADSPPPADPDLCKEERYAAHRENPSCAGCHALMDPVGFGLEGYGYDGKYRATDPAAPTCDIVGDGEIVGVGTFNGPGQLGGLLVDNEIIDACAVSQLYRYAMGRQEDEAGETLINELAASFSEDGHHFDQLMLELVSDPSFRFRLEEEL